MLTAIKSKSFERLFAIYNRNLFKRRFHSLRVGGFGELRKPTTLAPLVIFANHSAWWDGLVAFEISRRVQSDSFIMMEERHLKKLFLFRGLGAFSVVREKPREAIKSIDYAAELLCRSSNRTVWIFPQGEILPNERRPLRFYNGLAKLVEKVGAVRVLPVAMRYEFLDNFKPEIFVKIGKTEEFVEADKNFNSKKLTARFADNLTVLLNDLKSEIASENLENYERVI
jgi:chlorobactene lauroyltransferase